MFCELPSKLSILVNHENSAVDRKSGRLVLDNSMDFSVDLTVKDKKGNTFDTVESLKFHIEASDQSTIKVNDFLEQKIRLKAASITGKRNAPSLYICSNYVISHLIINDYSFCPYQTYWKCWQC